MRGGRSVGSCSLITGRLIARVDTSIKQAAGEVLFIGEDRYIRNYNHGAKPRPSSYYVPCKSLLPKAEHRSHKRLNNRVENAHQPTRKREKQMVRFKSPASANQFLATHGQVRNLFMVGRCTETASTRRVNLSASLHLWDDIAHSCQKQAA